MPLNIRRADAPIVEVEVTGAFGQKVVTVRPIKGLGVLVDFVEKIPFTYRETTARDIAKALLLAAGDKE